MLSVNYWVNFNLLRALLTLVFLLCRTKTALEPQFCTLPHVSVTMRSRSGCWRAVRVTPVSPRSLEPFLCTTPPPRATSPPCDCCWTTAQSKHGRSDTTPPCLSCQSCCLFGYLTHFIAYFAPVEAFLPLVFPLSNFFAILFVSEYFSSIKVILFFLALWHPHQKCSFPNQGWSRGSTEEELCRKNEVLLKPTRAS